MESLSRNSHKRNDYRAVIMVMVIMIALLVFGKTGAGQQVYSSVYIDTLDTNRCSRYLLFRYKQEYSRNPTAENAQKIRAEEKYIKKKCTCEIKREVSLDTVSEPGVWQVKVQVYRREGDDCIPGKLELLYRVDAPHEELAAASSSDKNTYFDPIVVLIGKSGTNNNGNSLVPFDYESHINSYYNWARGENIDGEFCLVVPSARTQKVWVVTPKNRPIEAKKLSISLFILPKDEQEQKIMYSMIKVLSLCTVNDPELKILYTPDNSHHHFVVAGEPSGQDYILGFRFSFADSLYNVSSYIPVQLIVGVSASRQYIRSLRVNHSYLESSFSELIEHWRDTGEGQVVKAILPGDCVHPTPTFYDPLTLVGNPKKSEEQPKCLERALQSGASLSLLIEKNWWEYAKWTKDAKYPSWYSSLKSNKNPWLAWLALADTSIKVVAENSSAFCFISENDLNTLWSWVVESSFVPVQNRLLKGEENFGLLYKDQSAYIRGLRHDAGPWERNLFLDYASKPDSFHLLDFFESDRTMLYQKTQDKRRSREHILRVYSVGQEIDSEQPIDFYYVDGTQGTDIVGLQKAYNTWQFRQIVRDSLVMQDLLVKEAWFGSKRLGTVINRSAQNENALLQVFLGPGDRFLTPISFGRVRKLVKKDGKHVYKNPSFDLKTDMFKGWLLEDWRRTGIWRANPLLGYFDRRD